MNCRFFPVFAMHVILSVTLLVTTAVHAEEPKRHPAPWPAANGPVGNYNPLPFGHSLVDDLADARLKWESDYHDLGYAKGTVSGFLAILAKWPGHPGSWSGVIVADGKVFASSYRPTGEVWAKNMPHLKHDKNAKLLDEHGDQLRRNLRINADDLTVALDQQTGKTLWVAVEEGQGVNRYTGKRESFAVAPVYDDGRVFSMGTTGRLYAYDAGTGKKLWESNIGPGFERRHAEKAEVLKELRLPKQTGWDCSLVAVGGVLIVPTYDDATNVSLRGLDVKSGQKLWEVPAATSRYATPATFHHQGREYVLTANRRGEMRLIDPRSGKVLWTVEGLQPIYYSLTPSRSHVMVNVGSEKSESKGRPHGLLAAYTLSPSGAKKAWTMPDRREFYFENHMDSCARRRMAIRDGLV